MIDRSPRGTGTGTGRAIASFSLDAPGRGAVCYTDPVAFDKTIGFLGAGNMAEALIRGLLHAGVAAAQIGASGPRQERAAELRAAHGIRAGTDNCELARGAQETRRPVGQNSGRRQRYF